MKKTALFLVVLLSSMHTNAVHLSTDGSGQVLIFPYYTVNNGFNTLITLTNTTDQAKALRVRFREAANSREVFTFNLYLGAYDMWTGALLKGTDEENNFTKIISNDTSCTIPSMQSNLFTNHRFIGSAGDVYGNETLRMHEGFIEVIEMGVLTGGSAAAVVISNVNEVPANCALLQDAWDENSDNPYWLTDAETDMQAPTGGIVGNVVLISVESGISIDEESTAIKDFSDEVLHFNTDNDSPSLADGKTTSTVVTKGQKHELEWITSYDAVSSVLMKNTLTTEYVLTDGIGANTDWIFTLPTRQYYIDPLHTGSNVPRSPFTSSGYSGANCELFDEYGRSYDRESNYNMRPPLTVVVGPPPPQPPELCFTSNSFSFGESVSRPQGIFASNFSPSNPSKPGFDTGWVTLEFLQATTSQNNFTLTGLPMIGFSMQRYINGNLSGNTLANYAGIFNLKSTVSVSNNSSGDLTSGMTINQDNMGQALIYPYYTVNNGFDTLISVVNTTNQVRAIKVRFLEGKNSRECLDFNLYLSPYDVWTAALIATTSTAASGLADQNSTKIITSDTSCTAPAINGQEFLSFAFTGAFDDGITADMQRCTEGHFELIEMGTVVGADAAAATHHPSGVPTSCATILGNWAPGSGQWSIDPSVNMVAPDGTGGLYGSTSLIHVAGGIDMSYDAVAIDNYTTAIQHTDPGSLLPNLSSGSNSTTLIQTDEGFMQTTWDSPLDAVSALFMQENISNDYVITDGIGAQTDWITTYPTKQFHTDSFYTSSAPTRPFSQVLVADVGACEVIDFTSYNREQIANFERSLVGIRPPGIYTPKHCWSVNVGYADDSSLGSIPMGTGSIFGSTSLMDNWLALASPFSIYNMEATEGWMQTTLGQGMLEGVGQNGEMHKIFGKPVMGFVAQKFVNGTLEDTDGNSILANYAAISLNKSKRKFEVIEPE